MQNTFFRLLLHKLLNYVEKNNDDFLFFMNKFPWRACFHIINIKFCIGNIILFLIPNQKKFVYLLYIQNFWIFDAQFYDGTPVRTIKYLMLNIILKYSENYNCIVIIIIIFSWWLCAFRRTERNYWNSIKAVLNSKTLIYLFDEFFIYLSL